MRGIILSSRPQNPTGLYRMAKMRGAKEGDEGGEQGTHCALHDCSLQGVGYLSKEETPR